ncbi:hypothetical protein CANINC_001074 [Pichia inconspicua]|uniref:Mitochondrial 15S rRNA processing factor CCM1 n=1 Tax=Pichia inconspicua TaxID=52247 RepID=A0A4T0X5V3_9ASCO|nr:hypothetical protein CANINC_001074 [[Candida] inconspicua]
METSHLNRINSKLTEQLQALETMTKEVKETLKKKKEEKELQETKEDLSINKSEVSEEDIDKVFNSLGLSETENQDKILSIPKFENTISEEVTPGLSADFTDGVDLMEIFPQPKPYVPLPLSVMEVLSPEQISHITREETADWNPVLDGLLNSSICDPTSTNIAKEQFTSHDFHKLVVSIPRNHKIQVVEKLHELALRSGVLWGNVVVMNHLLSLCSLLSKEKACIIVEALLNDLELNNPEKPIEDESCEEVTQAGKDDKIVANTITKSILLNHYARVADVTKVRELVADLNQLPDNKNPMKTSPIIYTSIMQMYMRLNNYELAKETFDTMKFLSISTSPSYRTYTSMILLDTLHNNIEHGISVYEEMKNKEMKIEPQALLALAKGCGARKGMIAQGWDFVIKYYQEGFPVDSQVMETMMYLAYVDGDLPFVRGIWANICETNTKLHGTIHLPHPKCTKWLFNTYYKVAEFNGSTGNDQHVPVVLTDARVKSIRTKVLELTNFSFHPDAPPLLPNLNLHGSNTKYIISEAYALWKYLIEKGEKDYIQQELIEAYLYVVGRYADIETFQQEWEKWTIFDNEGLENEVVIEIEEPEDFANTSKETKQLQNRETQTFRRFLRNDRLYNMCMHIARHQGSLSFAQKIWSERGRYRKGANFQKLSITDQDSADFKFARLMLSTLTYTGNVGDAYKLVLSSQNRFVWTKYHLKSLISVCEQMGYTTFSRELQSVIRKSNKWIRRQSERN